jgi:hypothetical protein
MLLFWKEIDKTQIPKPPECASTFFKKFESVYVGHLGLQSITYRVDTPACIYVISCLPDIPL